MLKMYFSDFAGVSSGLIISAQQNKSSFLVQDQLYDTLLQPQYVTI